MSNKDSGFLKLYRTFFDHFLWDEDREFSKAEAWIDLLQTARYKEGTSTEMVNGQVVEWERGELLASVRFLKKRWNWNSTGKVTRFLELLEKQNMVLRKTEQGVTVISICNYCSYNPIENDNGTATEHGQNRDRTETEREQVQNSKKDKKDKKENNIKSDKIVDVISDIDSIKDKDVLLALHIWNDVNDLRPNNKTTLNAKVENWSEPIRLMVEQDDRTHKEIWNLWQKVHRDSFWQKNVLSTAKLRDKFDQLAIKLETNGKDHGKFIDQLFA